MRRSRPRQHKRRLKSGKVITVNKGKKYKRKRFNENQYKYVTGIIKNKRQENVILARQHNKLENKIDEGVIPFRKRIVLRERLGTIKREIAENSMDVDRLNKKYFPKNPR